MRAILNLKDGAQGNNIAYEIKKLPDGHQHIDLSSLKTLTADEVTIKMRLRDGNDMFILKQAVDAIRYVRPNIAIELHCMYLLAARWDRRMYVGDSFDLKIVIEDLNRLNFSSIRFTEPHSAISSAITTRSYNYTPLDHYVGHYVKHLKANENFVIFAPDLGAVKRVEGLIKDQGLNVGVGYMHKERELTTGKILGMKVLDAPALNDTTVLIFDDLCDGGRTFIEASKLLKDKGVNRIVLAVTHGIFSKGYEPLFEGGIDEIITTDSFSDPLPDPRVTVLKCI